MTTRHQVRGDPPDTFRLAFNDACAAQCLEPPDVGIDDFVGMRAMISLRPKLRTMLRSPVHAILTDRRNVAIRYPRRRRSYCNDTSDRKFAQVRPPERHVVSPSIDAVDDDVALARRARPDTPWT